MKSILLIFVFFLSTFTAQAFVSHGGGFSGGGFRGGINSGFSGGYSPGIYGHTYTYAQPYGGGGFYNTYSFPYNTYAYPYTYPQYQPFNGPMRGPNSIQAHQMSAYYNTTLGY